MNFEAAKIFIEQKLKGEILLKFEYHNIIHMMDVYQAAIRIAESESIENDDLILLLTAVLFHDSGFILGNENHEVLSCEIAEMNLPLFGYDAVQIRRIKGLIMATKIPQDPQNLLEEVICDADLDYLGRSDFWKIGNKLLNELRNCGAALTEYEWNEKQLLFLEKHSYFTKSSKDLRNGSKETNLKELKVRLASP